MNISSADQGVITFRSDYIQVGRLANSARRTSWDPLGAPRKLPPGPFSIIRVIQGLIKKRVVGRKGVAGEPMRMQARSEMTNAGARSLQT